MAMDDQRQTRQGGYVGINQYLQANKPQAERMGQQIAQNVGQKAQTATTGVSNLYDQFQQQSQAAQVDPNITTQIKEDPTKVTQSAYQKALAGYQGPQGLADVQGYQSAAGQIRQAQEDVNLLGQGRAGYGALIRGQGLGGIDYSRGQSALDTALLAGSQGAREALGGTAQRYQGISDFLGGAESSAATRANELATTARGIQEQLPGLVQSEHTAILDAATQAAQDQTAKDQALYDARVKAIQEGPGWAQKKAANALGLGDQMGNLSTALKYMQGPEAWTASDIATEEQRNRAAALEALGGLASGFGDPRSQQAGLASFDEGGFLKEMEQIRAKKEADEKARQDALNAARAEASKATMPVKKAKPVEIGTIMPGQSYIGKTDWEQNLFQGKELDQPLPTTVSPDVMPVNLNPFGILGR